MVAVSVLSFGLVDPVIANLMPSTLTYFVVRLGNGLLAIATLAIFSRLLSPTQYGKYALLIAVTAVLSSVFFQWLSAAIGRFLPKYSENPAKIMAVITRWFWLASAGLVSLFIIALAFHKKVNMQPVTMGLLCLITLALGRYTIALQIANSQNVPMQYCMLSWTKISVALLASVGFIYCGLGEQGALLGFLVGLVLTLIVFEPPPRMGFLFGKVDANLSNDMCRYGLPLTLNFLAIVLLDLVDRFMIATLLGVTYVGPYSLAYDFVQLAIGPFLNIFFLSAFPIIVHLYEARKHSEANAQLQALGEKLIGFGLPLVVCLSVLSGDISGFLFGLEFQHDAHMIMPWLAAAIFVAVFKSYYLDVPFQLHHATKYQSYIAVVMVITNIVLNLIFLPRYGVIAAAWSTLAAFIVGATLSWAIGRNFFSMPNLKTTVWKVFFAGFCMGLVLFLFSPLVGITWLLVKIVLAIIAYSILVLVFKIAGFSSFLMGCRHKLIDSK